MLGIMSSLPGRAVCADEEHPTPPPSSAVVLNDGPLLFGIDPAAVTSIDELPPELRGNPYVIHALQMTPEEHAYVVAWSLAAEEGRGLYGDEASDAWLQALEDGTHPLCRVPEPARR
jgi:hypothetical protein